MFFKALATAAALGLAGSASAAIAYEARTTTGGDGAFFNNTNHYMQVVTLNTPVTAQTLNGMVFGIRWLNNTGGNQGVIFNFYSGADESPSSTDALATATLVHSRSFNIPQPAGLPAAGASLDYNIPLDGALINVNKLAVEVIFTNATFTALSTSLGARITTGTPTVGSNDGFWYTDPNPPTTTSPDLIFQGTERTRINGAVSMAPVNTNVRMAIDTTVPAPAAAGLLGLAGLAAARRRR